VIWHAAFLKGLGEILAIDLVVVYKTKHNGKIIVAIYIWSDMCIMYTRKVEDIPISGVLVSIRFTRWSMVCGLESQKPSSHILSGMVKSKKLTTIQRPNIK